MNPKLEQRKFVVPEVIIGYESSLHVGKYLKQFGAHKAMIVTDKNVTEQIWFSKIIQTIKDSEIEYTLFDDVTGNPKDFEAMLGAELFLAENCDSIVAIGGGSPMDCAKCIGIVATNGGHILDYIGVDEIRLPGPPLICIPTTAGTSADVSQFAIITDTHEHVKKAIISKKVVPDLALLDPLPLMTMDSYLTACTGMDALTHAVEAYVSNAASPLTDVHALKAISTLYRALPSAVLPDRPLETMNEMLLGSLHAGFAFSNASLGAVHAFAHSLGGLLDLTHGECNSILLQKIIQVNFPYAHEKYRKIAGIIGLDVAGASDDEVKSALVAAISSVRESVSIPEFILLDTPDSGQLDAMTQSALSDPCMVTNPKEMTYDEVRDLYANLFKTQ